MPPIASDEGCQSSTIETTQALEELVGTHKKQQSQRPPTTTRTIVFLDWDDTLLCSSVLSTQGIKLDSDIGGAEDLMKQLDDLSTSIIDTITIAMSYGEVHIVTNGETGWVQLSAAKFVPRVVPYLEKVHVLSARSTFEELYPDSPMKWKYCAFQRELEDFYGDDYVYRNVLSFGDSHAEREAIRAVTRGRPYTKTKSIKFAERPSIEQLQRQLELVGNCFQFISHHEEDLDLCMSLSVGANQPQQETDQQEQQQQSTV